jgi:hypothetical protein
MCAVSPPGWVSAALALSCAACAGNTAPKGWLPEPEQSQAEAYGGWIQVIHMEGQAQRSTEGELIAVSADSIWVLNQNYAVAIPTASVKDGKLTAYAARKGRLATWTGLGAVATVSNGAYLIFTAPMWIIGGSVATAGETRAPQRKAPPLSWPELAPYARFPLGIPEGIELGGLKAKPSP